MVNDLGILSIADGYFFLSMGAGVARLIGGSMPDLASGCMFGSCILLSGRGNCFTDSSAPNIVRSLRLVKMPLFLGSQERAPSRLLREVSAPLCLFVPVKFDLELFVRRVEENWTWLPRTRDDSANA